MLSALCIAILPILTFAGEKGWNGPHLPDSMKMGLVGGVPFRQRLLGIPSKEFAPQRTLEKTKPDRTSAQSRARELFAGGPDTLAAGGLRQKRPVPSALKTGTSSRAGSMDIHSTWERGYSADYLPSRDNANAVAIDSAGNIIVAGYSEATYSSGDYIIIKYTGLGDTVWTRRYNGSGNNVDEATAVAADLSGNIVVTGYSYNASGNTDFVTLKFDAAGALLWERRYDGPGDSTDVATGIAVDPSGNINITGYSYDRTNEFDYVTISYAPDGSMRWISRFDGDAHANDIPASIAVGSDGGVVVTGFSEGAFSGFDCATVRYTSDGSESWHARYNGSANSDDRGSAVICDLAGNSFVCGSSTSAADHDFLTIKYDALGAQVWTAAYNGTGGGDDRATALTIDARRNIFVTGFSLSASGYYSFATVKYDASGNEIWRQRHAGPPGSNAFSTSIVADTSSGVVETGYLNDVYTTYSTMLTVRYDSAGNELWGKTYDGQPHGYDIGVAVVLDAAGNAYVAGTAVGPSASQDAVVVRYDAARFPLWPVRFDATGNGSEKLTEMSVGKGGNIYVTGFGYIQSVAGYGIITVAYDPFGRQLWSSVLDSSGADLETPVMFVDDNHSVYVSALSYYGGSFHSGFVTAKYDSNGVCLWTSRYSLYQQSEIKGIVVDQAGNVTIAGSNFYQRQMLAIRYDAGGRFQWANSQNGTTGAIALDSAGRVVMTGTVDGFASRANIVTVMLTANGDTAWTALYDGPNSSIDGSSAMSIDRGGHIYVGGSIYTAESGYQFVTICYDSSGLQRWSVVDGDTGRSFSTPAGISAANPSRISLTGRSPSTNNYTTLTYDASGTFLWRRGYNGTGAGTDDATSIAVDQDGDVVVTGTSPGSTGSTDIATIRYSQDGFEKWHARYNSPANGADAAQQVGIGRDGFVFVAGTSKGDYLIIRYDSLGVGVGEADYRWPSVFNGPGLSNASPSAITVDTTGAISVAGTTIVAGGSLDVLLLQYSSDGAPLSTGTYDGYGFGSRATAIAADKSGNRYVAGDIVREFGSTDIATLKYGATGVRQWIARYNSLNDDYDFSRSVGVDDSGNVYTGGYSVGRGSGYDFVFLKYGADGTPKWESRYDGPAGGDDILATMKVEPDGSLYATGLSLGAGTKSDYATVKIDRAGSQLWTARYNGIANDDDRPSGIAVDEIGNVYVTGSSKAQNGYYDFLTVKYDSNGVEQWVSRYDGPTQKDDIARAISVDGHGHVYVTGESDGGMTGVDFLTVQYDTSGNELWARRFDGPEHGDDRPRAMAADSSGSCYVTGKSFGSDATNDFATIKYTQDGTLEWETRYSLAPNVDDEPAAMALDKARNLFVTGESYGALWSTVTTIRYSQTLVEVPVPPHFRPTEFRLYDNYPNPFNPVTTVQYSLAAPGIVTLKIYNILGEGVATLVDGPREAGVHRVQWNAGNHPSGVYYARLASGTLNAVKEMILVK